MIQTLLATNTGLRPHQRKDLAEFEAFFITTLGHPESTTTHEKSDSQVNTALESLAQHLLPIVQLQWAALTSLKSLEQNLRPDLQAILTVLGQRVRTFGNGESQQLDLHNTNLQDANLAGAQLLHANLTGAQLQDAFLGGAQLLHANLTGAQLQGVDLRKAQNLTQEQINTACVDETTTLPEGLTKPAPCPANP